MTHRRSLRCTQSGFSLIELSVVVMVIGLLLSSMLLSLSKQDEIKRIKLTEQRLEAAREALIGFAIVNGRLPRPALPKPALPASDGTEGAICSNDANCTGFIPWAILGVQRLDGFDKLIRYSVTPKFANELIKMTPTPPVPTKSIAAGGGIYLAGAVSCADGIKEGCVPAVVYSSGKRNFGTTIDGKVLPNSSLTNTDEQANDTADTQFISREYTINTTASGGEFDDIVTWLPNAVLLSRLVQAGKLP